ncbi:MAG: iron ABC transporter permease, partial [Alphaproteobacteria bacterium]|nr:iron ABC transporter permease [Alphaproteobacteria bacterium]
MSVDATKGKRGSSSALAWPEWANGWTIGLFAVAIVVSLPLVSIIGIALTPAPDVWRHLSETVLWSYIGNTLVLAVGVGVGTFLIGTSTAWLVTVYDFPGRKIFEWALLVPLAVPAYVIAYTYTDLLDYTGAVQGVLRSTFGWQSARDYWFPEIRGLGGAICMFTLVLYPYVYLLARSAFLSQSVGVMEVSRTLGRRRWQAFFA